MKRVFLFLLPACLLILGGCTTVIRPPAQVATPATVYLLDHGRHTSLVLPIDGGMVRYAYGDWRWYAQGDTGISQGLAALLGPTQATLGRRMLPGETPAAALGRLRVGVETTYELQVEATAVAELRNQLERLHAAPEQRIDNQASDLEFVPHPRPYSLRNNSNSVVGEWLEALDCTVDGPKLLARWRVVDE